MVYLQFVYYICSWYCRPAALTFLLIFLMLQVLLPSIPYYSFVYSLIYDHLRMWYFPECAAVQWEEALVQFVSEMYCLISRHNPMTICQPIISCPALVLSPWWDLSHRPNEVCFSPCRFWNAVCYYEWGWSVVAINKSLTQFQQNGKSCIINEASSAIFGTHTMIIILQVYAKFISNY